MAIIRIKCPHCKIKNHFSVSHLEKHPYCVECKVNILEGRPIDGTMNNFQALLETKKRVVVDFWAPWCNPCVNFSPVFAKAAAERYDDFCFVKINTEEESELSAQFNIRSIPTLMVFEQKKHINTMNGAMAKPQFDIWLNQSLKI